MSALDDELVEALLHRIKVGLATVPAGGPTDRLLQQCSEVIRALRDALARDAQVAERVEEWPGLGWLRGKALGMAQDPYVKGKPHFHSELMALINSAAEIAALYPSPGDRDDSEEQR